VVFVEKWLADGEDKGMTLVAADRIATMFTKRYDGEGDVVACSLSDAPLTPGERHPTFKLSPMFPDATFADLAVMNLAKAIGAAEPGQVIGWDSRSNSWVAE